MARIRTAIVGAGHLGSIHARILQSLEAFELSVVADPAESARRAAGERFGVATAPELAPWLDRVDAVVLASPTSQHFAGARECLDAGLHAFVEKPLTPTAAEAAALVELADRRRRTLQVGHVERFNPAWIAARPHLSAPRFIECVREGAFSFRSTDVGVVLDLMIHDLDLVLALVSAPLVDVEACGAALLGKHEDTAFARLRFADGCTAVLSASRVASTATRRMRVRTAEAFATLDFQAKTASLVHLDPQLRNGRIAVERMSNDELRRCKEELHTRLLRHEELETSPSDAITAELTEFAVAIRSGRRPTASGVEGMASLRAAERILDAIAADRSYEAAPQPAFAGPHFPTSAAAVPLRRAG